MRPRPLAGALLVACVTVVSSLVALPPAAASASSSPLLATPLVRPAHLAPAQPAGSPRGRLPSSKIIALDFVLKSSDPSGLRSLLASQYDPASPAYHHWLAAGEFDRRFGPSPASVAALDSWLESVGLKASPAQGLIVSVSAPVRVVSKALHVGFESYSVAGPRGGKIFFTSGQPPLMPSGLASELTGVSGLDNALAFRPMIVKAGRSHLSGGSTGTPAQVGAHYGIDSVVSSGYDGTGQTIGVYEVAAHSAADVSAFEAKYGFTNVVKTVQVDGGAPVDISGGGTEEADLDIEDALSQAPGATIISYEGPQTGNSPVDIFEKIVSDDVAQVITTSWGSCETDYGSSPADLSPYDILFEQAASQGQAIFAASGDSGSEDCYQTDGTRELSTDYPGTDPYVTSVGGTTLTGSGGADTVWNDCIDSGSINCAALGGGAGGGGISTMYAKPSWQDILDRVTPAVPGVYCGQSCRGVPDISADADPSTGYQIYYDGHSDVVGGTSAAAPLVAGLAADVNTSCASATGDLAPALYAYAGQSAADGGLYGSAFTDVVSGNNDLTNTHGGSYAATAGFDLASGIGTPIATGWICPQVTSLSSAFATAGSTLTVTGRNLAHASVYFGTTAATIVSATDTQAVVTVPAGSGRVTVSASTPLGTGTQTATFSYPVTNHGTGGGYWLLAQQGKVYSFGSAQSFGDASFNPGVGSAVAIASVPAGSGYWVVSRGSQVKGFGSASSYRLQGVPDSSVVAIVSTVDGAGYWIATASGQVLIAGDATSYGSPSASGLKLDGPIVNMAATPDGGGYWLLGSDGGVFSYGDAHFFGSTGNLKLKAPAVAMAPTADGAGYWFVAADGGVFTFGDAAFHGSMGGTPLNAPVIGMVATPDGAGYWLVAADGGVFTFGDAKFVGSLGGQFLPSPIVAMAPA